ncbi:MAG TPA: ribose 5-phosphate isomerase B [Bdellovibrionota bacterium]|nr:ribose 5-phosphate isomerase B [Bdellovibrionota bacterium]
MKAAPQRSTSKIAIAADHAGYKLKEVLKTYLRSKGIDTVDFGTNSPESVDYPDYAKLVADPISSGEIAQGILICGTGIGMSITANKYPGVRAAVAATPYMAEMARAHNNANILCLGGRVVDEPTARQILDAWLAEPFEGGRHERRVEKMNELDRSRTPEKAKRL